MYRVTTNGITKGTKPYELICESNPFTATIKDFERLMLLRGFEFPKDLVCKNSPKKIVFEYSFLEANEFIEKVQIEFNVQKIND